MDLIRLCGTSQCVRSQRPRGDVLLWCFAVSLTVSSLGGLGGCVGQSVAQEAETDVASTPRLIVNPMPGLYSYREPAVAFTSDGGHLVSDTGDTASVWSLESGRLEIQFSHSEPEPPGLDEESTSFSISGDRVVFWKDTGEIHSWTQSEGFRNIGSCCEQVGRLSSLRISQSGSRVALMALGSSLGFTNVAVQVLELADEEVESVTTFQRRFFNLWPMRGGLRLDLRGERLLLYWEPEIAQSSLTETRMGLELIEVGTGEVIWSHSDMELEWWTPVFTADGSGIVVKLPALLDETYGLLDAADGSSLGVGPEAETFQAHVEETATQLGMVPCLGGGVALGLIRMWMVEGDPRMNVARFGLSGQGLIGSGRLPEGAEVDFAECDVSGGWWLLGEKNMYERSRLWSSRTGGSFGLWQDYQEDFAHDYFAGADQYALSSDGRFLARGHEDGRVSVWRLSHAPAKAEKLADLVAFPDGGWAVLRGDGRYDSSDPAEVDGLSWQLAGGSEERVPLSRFYREYYEPRLLVRLMAGEEFPERVAISELDRTPLRVKIVGIQPSGERRVDVLVAVSESTGEGARELKLFRNGQMVESRDLSGPSTASRGQGWRFRAGELVPESGRRHQDGTGGREVWLEAFLGVELPAAGADEVEFGAYALNRDRVKSETDYLGHPRRVGEPVRRAFVVVVGIDAYQNPAWDLRYAAHDAMATREILARRLGASEEFDEVTTVSLVTERDAYGEMTGTASREALLAVLDVLAGRKGDQELLASIPGAGSLGKVGPDDLVYLSFSGHGLSGEDGRFHFFLSDVSEGSRRTVDSELLARSLDSDVLASYLSRVDAGRFVLVIDACNAAASVEGGDFKPGPMGSRGLGQLAYDKAMVVVAASQSEAVALESEELKHGLLTYALFREGLEGEMADWLPKDGTIALTELLGYGAKRVPELYEELREGTFLSDGRNAEVPFRPVGQVEVLPQQPSVFDFSRGNWSIRLPVTGSGD